MLSDINPDMLIYREETFGPVAAIVPYDDDDDVIAMANDTNYGLAAYIYTTELARAMRLFEALDFGIIGINDINPTAAAAPFGGVKESGIGREGGKEGIEEYLDVKLGGFAIWISNNRLKAYRRTPNDQNEKQKNHKPLV